MLNRSLLLPLILAAATAAAQPAPPQTDLPEVLVEGVRAAPPQAAIGTTPPPYAGGQVARGSRVGLLGNRDFMETPFSTSSYTDRLIRDQQARVVGDVLQNDPSVRVTSARGNYFDQYFIRGFRALSSDIAYDGLFGLVPSRRPTIESAERVELLRGPNALLSGISPSGFIAGTINLVPRFAGEEPLTRITAGLVSRSSLGTILEAERRAGPDNAFGIRGSLAARRGNTPTDGQSERYLSGDVNLDYQGERLRVTALFGGADEKVERGQQVLTVAPGFGIPRAPSSGTNLQQNWEYQVFDSQRAALRAEYDVLPGTTLGAAYGRGRTYERWYYSGLRLTNARGDVTATPAYYNGSNENETAEASLRSRFSTGPVSHQVSLVANAFWRDSFSRTRSLPGGSIATNLYSPAFAADPGRAGIGLDLPRTGDNAFTSIALTDILSVWDDRAQLILGGRSQRIASRSYNVDTGARTARYADTALTPALGVLVRPLQPLSLYANYIEGLTQGPTAPVGSRNVGAIFPPALSRQYEAGVKLDLGGIGAQLAWFSISQQSGALDPASNVYGVIGQQRNEGVELLTFGQAAPGVRLLGGVTFTEGTLTRTAGGTNNGRAAPGVPRWAVSMGGEWDTPWVPPLTLTGRVIYTSSQYYDAANTQRIPDWARLDIGARYGFTVRGKPAALRAAIENVTGADYWQSTAAGFLAPSPPRTYLLSTSFEF